MSGEAGKKKWNSKKEFEWDTHDHKGFVPCTERRQIGAAYVTKGDYEYILLTDYKYYKKDGEENWNIVKGFTIPLHAWKGIDVHVQDILDEHGDGE